MLKELKTVQRVAGVKQSIRVVRSGEAKRVFLARDADPVLLQPLRTLCEEREIPVEEVRSMRELGEVSGIAVGAAAVAVVG